jgi:PTS system sucrose-specific IIC component
MAKTPDYQEIAKQIIEVAGGAENIISAAHCATRLRLIVKNREIIDDKKVEAIEIVKGCFFTAGQYQIILGTGVVNKVYDEVIKMNISGTSKNEQAAAAAKSGNALQRLVRVFADVFVPIIPVMVATGLFMGLRGFLTQDALLAFFGTSSAEIPQQFLQFTQILTDTAFGFLPVLVCWSAFKKFGGSPVLGIVIGLMLVSNILPSSWDVAQGNADPMVFFGFIKVNGYQSSVLPAFIIGFLGSKIEQWLHDHVINALDLIITPFVTVLTSLCLGLFIVGPIFHTVEMELVGIVTWLFSLPFGIGGFIWGALCQVIVITGIHHALNLVEIEMLAATKWNPVNPVGSCGIVAQAGAAIAVAVKTKSVKMKSLAYPSSVSALLGITEPAIFGVNLRLVNPFVFGCIGGGVGGWLSVILNLRGTGMSISGIPGMLLYMNSQLPLYILVNVVAFAVAFVLTYLFGVKGEVAE